VEVSVICLGVDHSESCGDYPSDVKVREVAHNIFSPSGIPSSHETDVPLLLVPATHPEGLGSVKLPLLLAGFVGVLFILTNIVLLNADCPSFALQIGIVSLSRQSSEFQPFAIFTVISPYSELSILQVKLAALLDVI